MSRACSLLNSRANPCRVQINWLEDVNYQIPLRFPVQSFRYSSQPSNNFTHIQFKLVTMILFPSLHSEICASLLWYIHKHVCFLVKYFSSKLKFQKLKYSLFAVYILTIEFRQCVLLLIRRYYLWKIFLLNTQLLNLLIAVVNTTIETIKNQQSRLCELISNATWRWFSSVEFNLSKFYYH